MFVPETEVNFEDFTEKDYSIDIFDDGKHMLTVYGDSPSEAKILAALTAKLLNNAPWQDAMYRTEWQSGMTLTATCQYNAAAKLVCCVDRSDWNDVIDSGGELERAYVELYDGTEIPKENITEV